MDEFCARQVHSEEEAELSEIISGSRKRCYPVETPEWAGKNRRKSQQNGRRKLQAGR
jgi:hypothetical protein